MKKKRAFLGVIVCVTVLLAIMNINRNNTVANIGWYATSRLGGGEGAQWAVAGAVGYGGGLAGAWAGAKLGGLIGSGGGPVGAVVGGMVGAGVGAF